MVVDAGCAPRVMPSQVHRVGPCGFLALAPRATGPGRSIQPTARVRGLLMRLARTTGRLAGLKTGGGCWSRPDRMCRSASTVTRSRPDAAPSSRNLPRRASAADVHGVRGPSAAGRRVQVQLPVRQDEFDTLPGHAIGPLIGSGGSGSQLPGGGTRQKAGISPRRRAQRQRAWPRAQDCAMPDIRVIWPGVVHVATKYCSRSAAEGPRTRVASPAQGFRSQLNLIRIGDVAERPGVL